MARPLRIEFPDALYHVTSRGDRKEDIFNEYSDRLHFLSILSDVCQRYNWELHAYCLMDNHYHLLIETPDANLSRGMRHLNGVYTQWFNRSHSHVGHVFQGRFKSIIIEKEAHLLELSRYIVLNPVRARMVRHPKNWPWSSYQATAGEADTMGDLNPDWILPQFAKRKSTAIQRYKQFVLDGIKSESPWGKVKNQIFLGSDQFIKKVLIHVPNDKDLDETPKKQKRMPAKQLEYYENNLPNRNSAIAAAYKSGEYSLKQIGDYFELHYSRVSRIIQSEERKAKNKT